MNVTGVEWRGQDPRDGRFAASVRQRRERKPADADQADIVEVHGEDDQEPADEQE